jgi:hypothetical protein
MATMFIRHTVSDYKAWRKVYDDVAPMQKAGGVTAQAVYQAADNPNDITVTHEFGSVEAAQAFAKSDELKKAMEGALESTLGCRRRSAEASLAFWGSGRGLAPLAGPHRSGDNHFSLRPFIHR